MPISAASAPRARPAGLAFAALLGLALLTSAPVWWIYARPVLSLAAAHAHAGHMALLYAHAVGGTVMIVAGAAALYVGHTGRWRRHHRLLGRTYIIGGGLGALAALALSIQAYHAPRSLGVATGTLAVVWLAFAAMAWRAAVNRRFDTHREWVIRSYVATWTFVGCRIAQAAGPFPALGPEGVTAGIWLFWVAPLLITEIALQWRRGAAQPATAR